MPWTKSDYPNSMKNLPAKAFDLEFNKRRSPLPIKEREANKKCGIFATIFLMKNRNSTFLKLNFGTALKKQGIYVVAWYLFK